MGLIGHQKRLLVLYSCPQVHLRFQIPPQARDWALPHHQVYWNWHDVQVVCWRSARWPPSKAVLAARAMPFAVPSY